MRALPGLEMLCTISRVAAISGFPLACSTCSRKTASECNQMQCEKCKTAPSEKYEILIEVVNHDKGDCSRAVQLKGNYLQQVLGIPPSKLHSYMLRLHHTNRMLQEAVWDMLVGQSALLTCKQFTRTITVIPLSFQVVGDDYHTILNYLPLHPRTPRLPLKQSEVSSSQSDLSQSFTPSRSLPLLASPSPYCTTDLHHTHSPSQLQRLKSEGTTPELFSHTNFCNRISGCSTPLVLHTLYHDSPEIL